MAITTKIKNYPATHGKNEGGGGGTTIIMGGGNADIPADLNVTSISADRGDISLLKGKSLTFNDGQFIYIGSNEGTVNKIRGNELKYKLGAISELHSDSIETKTLEADDLNAVNAWIDTLNSKSITTEYLTVTKQAHFFELVIDKIKSIGGQMIMTAANCVVDYVKAVDANGNYLANLDDASAKAYDIFWLSSDASGRAVTNDWQVNDQAICQSFNNVSTGVNYDVSNKYYWRLVTEKLTDRYMNLSTGAELPLGQSQQATVNSVTITAPYLADENDTRLDTGWNTQAQEITGVITGATWTETSGGAGQQTIGTMTTTNTVFGIQITPVKGEATETVYTNYFGFSCTPSRLNVGIYYTDKTSQYFTAPEQLQSSYRYETLTQAPIEAIVITNAEEVEWKLVHGIRLSNTDCDEMLDGYTSIPSAGDNVSQSGYRYNEYKETDPEYDTARSSAIIIAAYKTPDADIVPPSYAQYTDITDYELTSHRQSYFDATGAYFKGKLVTESGNEIAITDDGFDVNVEFYKIIPEYNIITISNNGNINPSLLNVRFLVSGKEQLDTIVPSNCKFKYTIDSNSEVTINGGNSVAINLTNMESNSKLSMSLYKGLELVDKMNITVTDIQGASGTNGLNAPYRQYAYVNDTIDGNNHNTPSVSSALYPPSGWTQFPSTPDFANDEYTWCTERDINFSTLNTPIYGLWQTPYRITGDNGRQGEDGKPGTAGKDGKYTEYIYFHSTAERTFSGNDNPANWNSSSAQDTNGHNYNDPDYTGPASAGWTDHPQGIGTINGVFYEVEYMASRMFNGASFEPFENPKIWSRWGQNGRDGDGYEYVFLLWHESTAPVVYDNDTYDGKTKSNDDYLPYSKHNNNKHRWTDEPKNLDSSNNLIYQFVSVRKKENNGWGNFSTPSLWNWYVKNGEQGPEGPQGPQGGNGTNGIDAEYYTLIPINENFEVRISATETGALKYEDITGKIFTYLLYAVAHVKGTNIRFLNKDELQANKFKIKINADASGAETNNFEQTGYTNGFINGVSVGALFFSKDNILEEMHPNNNNYQNYYYLVENNLVTSAPTKLNITLLKDTTDIDSTVISLIFKPSNIFSVTEYALNSIYQGLSGSEDGYSATGMSQIHQDWESIKTNVTNIQTDINNGTIVNKTTLEQTANSIKTTVTKDIEDVRKEIDYKVQEIVDLTGEEFDVNKFYPISIRLCANENYNSKSESNDRVRIVIDRTLDYDTFGNIKSDTNMTPNAYGTHNSNNGFDAVLDYTTQASGWGATWTSSGGSTTWGDNELNGQGYDTYRFINNYLVHWTVNQEYTYNSKTITIPRNAIFGSIRQNYMNSTEIVYARGGSKYRVRTDWRYAKIDKHPTGYDWSSGNYRRTAPVITWTDDSSLIIPEKDQMQKSEIIQTANNIQLNVYDQLKEKTGIDVSSGQITLDADNTIINGSLKIKNANEGVIIYNDEGQAAVEVVKDTIGTFGTSQNVTSYYKSSAFTYSCITGTNSFRQYIDPVDTSQGYSSELKYSENKENLSARVSFGNLKSGVKIKWNAKNFGAYIRAFGGDYNSKTGQYAYKVEGLNTSNYTLSQALQVRIRLRNVYADTWYTIRDWSNLTSVSSSSLDAWTSIPHSSGTYYWLNGVNIEHTINSDGYYELFFDYRMSNPTISGTSKFKLFYFDTYLSITNEISINTKIGTDGIRTITPNTELWAGADQISNIYQNSDKTGIYGSGINSFGYTVTKYGPTQAFGTQESGTQLSSLTAYDSVRQLIHVNGENKYKGNNRFTGKVEYNFPNPMIGGTKRYEFCYNYVTNGIMPGIVVFDGVEGEYSNVDPYFTFIYTYNSTDMSLTDTLPTGLTVIIINHSGRKLHVAAHRSLPQRMYNRDTTNLSTEIVIDNGRSATFVHLGDNYYKLI